MSNSEKPEVKTLVRIVKVLGGQERWYRIEGAESLVVEFQEVQL